MKKQSQKNTIPPSHYEYNDISIGSSCTLNHTELNLVIDEKNYKIYGSSCIVPIIHDADIYISLDCKAPSYQFENEKNTKKKHIRCFIEDGNTPKNKIEFQQCIEKTIEFLKENKKIHVGCIGGHGRTGVFFAALVQKCMPKYLEDNNIGAIDYIRKEYCHKAVETIPQIFFLNHYYQVKYPEKEIEELNELENKFKDHTGFHLSNQIVQSDFQSCMDIINILDINKKNFPYEGLITRNIRF